jgi:glycine cleavage system regulatory protein
MQEKVISYISVADEMIVIGWYESSDHPVQKEGSMMIPAVFAQDNEQLWQDFKEVLDDAQVLLESAEAAYHQRNVRMKEMGRG